jgi:CheY-like chemotaxis protein
MTMETTLPCENNKSLFVPAGLSAIGILGGKWIAMRTESIDRTGVFVIAKEYVRPREIFDLIIWPGENQSPIHVAVTASFVERTWDGYGIWAQISSSSTQSAARWAACYTRAALAGTQGYSEALRMAQLLAPQRIAVLGQTLPSPAIERLRASGVVVATARDEAQAYALAAHGEFDLIIASMNDPLLEPFANLRLPGAPNGPVPTLIISQHGSESEFESALHGGAAKVVARPCQNAMLVTRILALLYAERNPRISDITKVAGGVRRPRGRAAAALLNRLSGEVASWWSGAREVTTCRGPFQNSAQKRDALEREEA